MTHFHLKSRRRLAQAHPLALVALSLAVLLLAASLGAQSITTPTAPTPAATPSDNPRERAAVPTNLPAAIGDEQLAALTRVNDNARLLAMFPFDTSWGLP